MGIDESATVKSVRKAADQGDAEAQFELALIYQDDHQNYAEAARWFRMTAEQDDYFAQYYLGLMYAKGQGVPEDYVQAHMWLNLAVMQGHEDAKTDRDDIAKKMTPEQIAEAERLARERSLGPRPPAIRIRT